MNYFYTSAPVADFLKGNKTYSGPGVYVDGVNPVEVGYFSGGSLVSGVEAGSALAALRAPSGSTQVLVAQGYNSFDIYNGVSAVNATDFNLLLPSARLYAGAGAFGIRMGGYGSGYDSCKLYGDISSTNAYLILDAGNQASTLYSAQLSTVKGGYGNSYLSVGSSYGGRLKFAPSAGGYGGEIYSIYGSLKLTAASGVGAGLALYASSAVLYSPAMNSELNLYGNSYSADRWYNAQNAVYIRGNSAYNYASITLGDSSVEGALIRSNGGNIALETYGGTVGLQMYNAGSIKLGYNAYNYMGFFDATPVQKPTGVAVSAAGIHAALVSLGLIGA